MPISDLTGTKWVFNETITAQSSNTYVLNFKSSNNEVFIRLKIQGTGYPDAMSTWNMTYQSNPSGASGNAQAYFSSASSTYWTSEAYRTIEITGGTDATNSALIAWLQANATQQTPVQPSSGGMYFGALGISKIFMGNSEVSKIYLGDALVYEGATIPDNALLTADNTYLVDSTGGYLLTTEI